MSQTAVPPSIRPGGLVAGKYRIDSMLGEGGMGTVWAATHVELNQRVALKLISSELSRSPDLLARFRAEAKAAAQLSSRYVVRMYDSGVTEDGRPYIAMEFLTGESLEDRLTRVGALPLGTTVRIVSQVCRALKVAHAQGIIHRDLKPANIFLATTGDDEEVAKVLDFGIAKILDHERDHGATATGIILGTPLYMSPEQARALKTLDHRTDLYSLGMVTYRMLVGDPPFQGESFGDLVFSICTKPLPSMHAQVPTLPPSLDEWFQVACAKDQGARFATAEQMHDALWAASGMSASHFAQIDTGGHSVPGFAAAGGISGLGSSGRMPVTSPNGTVGMVDSSAHAALAASAVQSRGNAPTLTGSSSTASQSSKPRGTALWPVAVAGGALVLAGLVAGTVWLNGTPEGGEATGDSALGSQTGEGLPSSERELTALDTTAPARGSNTVAEDGAAEDSAAEATSSATTDASQRVAVTPVAPSASSGETLVEARPSSSGETTRPRPPRRPPSKPPESGEKPPAQSGNTGTPDMGF